MSASGLVMRFITKCEYVMGEKTHSSLTSFMKFSIIEEALTRIIVFYNFWMGMGGVYAG